mgnify:CR=1 FL=1
MLVVDRNAVVDGQIGALSINDLSMIMTFDENQNTYIDNLDYYLSLYDEYHENKIK